MIDQETIKRYPSLVARPYMLIKDDMQRKDMQRFWFENTISFLAILSAAELVRYYQDLKKEIAEETDETKAVEMRERVRQIQENKSLTMVGLEHMALGKWVMMLRESTRVLQEFGAAQRIPEVVEFYHGKNGKNNAKIIDKLVAIRNNDAHGNPIPEDKLSRELDKRQELIESLLIELSFLRDYQLILPEKLEIEGSQQYYICRQFIGNGVVVTKQEFDFSPKLSEVMLINQKMKHPDPLGLNPLLIYLGIQEEEKNFLGVFSKFTAKDRTEAKYLNLDGSVNIDLVNFGQEHGIDLFKARLPYDAIYSDPESFQANLDVKIATDTDVLQINEIGEIGITVRNMKSTDIESARFVIRLPQHFHISDDLPVIDEYNGEIEVRDGQLSIVVENIENDTEFTISPLRFTISEQGTFTIEEGTFFYQYYKSLSDKEEEQLTDEEGSFEGVTIEVNDPNSRDRMLPVINVSKEFVDTRGNLLKNVTIGEDFLFKLTICNIGFSSAKDVLIDLVFPDNLNLRKGKETIRLSLLNPSEEKTFEYVLNSKIPNVYTISMQNILYSDLHGKRYKTSCADEHFIIVRSDRIKEFEYTIEEHIDDLYIDEDEKENIEKMINELSRTTGVDGEKIYREAETEAVIDILRDVVKKTASKKNIDYVETVYVEGKRDSKITGSPSRKFLLLPRQITRRSSCITYTRMLEETGDLFRVVL